MHAFAVITVAAMAAFAGCAGDEQFEDPDFDLMDIVAYDASGRGTPADGAGGDLLPILAQDTPGSSSSSSSGGGTAKPTPTVSFSRSFGGKFDETLAAVIRQGLNLYSVGLTGSFGAGGKDALVARTDSCGKATWVKAYGGKGDDQALAASSVGSQIWIAGSTASVSQGVQAWLFRIGGNGLITTSAAIGGAGFDEAVSIAAMPDGGAVAVGNTDSYGPAAPKYASLMVVRVDKDSKVLWGRVYGKKYYSNRASSVVSLPNNGGFAVAGAAEGWGAGKDDFWLLRLDANGKFHWSMTYGTDQDDEATALLTAPDGGFFIAGHSDGFGAKSDDAIALKVNGAGQVQWATRIGSTKGDDRGWTATRLGTGYVVAGYSDAMGSGTDALLAKIAPSGGVDWVRSVGGSKTQKARSIVTSADGGIVSVGYTKGGDGGQSDAWLSRTEAKAAVGCNGEDLPPVKLDIESLKVQAAPVKLVATGGVNGATLQAKTTPAPQDFAAVAGCAGPKCQ